MLWHKENMFKCFNIQLKKWLFYWYVNISGDGVYKPYHK
jgi:hypothetical protein